ncbi:MAG: hypothetical protein AAF492_31130 [Verrucomicrobiota bacterium]
MTAFREFYFDYSSQDLFRSDGFIREFFEGDRRIQLLTDRAFRVRKLYLMNFVDRNVVWLVLPGEGYSAYRVEREEEQRFFYSGGVLGTRVHVDLPKEALHDELEGVEPVLLRDKVKQSLLFDDVTMKEPEFMEPFMKYYVDGMAVYDVEGTLRGTQDRVDRLRIMRYFDLP